MKNIYLYTLIFIGVLFISSCQKELFDAPNHPDATKLKHTDAIITTADLASGDVLSGKPVENDTLTLEYYSYRISNFYGLDANQDTVKFSGYDAGKSFSEISANKLADELEISRPVAYRAIAPTGTIGIMSSTTTGIEPIFATAYKRRYLNGKT